MSPGGRRATIVGREELSMRIEHEFWIEQATHAIWAVELREDTVAGCFGPLLLEDVDADLLEVYEYSPGGAAWIERNRERFGTFTPTVPELPET
jgi:hypothetical protein